MIVCVDLDQTVSADPQFYRGELEGLRRHGAQVFILTGNPKAADELSQLGFAKGREYDGLVQVPRKHIAKSKVAVMRQLGATHLIDNRAKNIKTAAKAGFTGHHHVNPKKEG